MCDSNIKRYIVATDGNTHVFVNRSEVSRYEDFVAITGQYFFPGSDSLKLVIQTNELTICAGHYVDIPPNLWEEMSTFISSIRVISRLARAKSPLMAICVKTIAGKQIPLSLPESAFVSDLAALVHESEGHSPEEQHLIYGGRWLAFEDRLSSYDVRDGATVHLLIRGKGRV
ncbi:hypothetical protein EDD18DRAFT_441304 [Armillaria luteobubalina]|uniref:Ubiquitin-like domain-containing protein n=2 Tax=Armillaria luteobubalina TaxID=153913 RepID=A0AA39Q0A6_9AGAR|nr:hypothetical protein EDD18DRAFT_441304 [Armillaria luteobubalina]